MHKIIIYTDGASSGNPGPGGFGAIVLRGAELAELGGRENNTTNNRMELKAAIEALKSLDVKEIKKENTIDIFCDSKYVIQGITSWVKGWQNNNWKTSTKSDVLNKDLWIELVEVTQNKNINWRLLKGHAGILGNERCDEIATSFSKNIKMDLFRGLIKDSKYTKEEIEKLILGPTLADLDEIKKNKESKEGKTGKAFSYVSLVEGRVFVHQDWASCKARVDGKSGVRFKKVFSKREEEDLVKEWQKN